MFLQKWQACKALRSTQDNHCAAWNIMRGMEWKWQKKLSHCNLDKKKYKNKSFGIAWGRCGKFIDLWSSCYDLISITIASTN